MNKKRKKTISEIFEEGTSIDEALKKGVQDAMLLHKKLGKPVVTWKNGKIIWLKPENNTGYYKKPAYYQKRIG